MRTVFADSFYWLALANRNDAAHHRAIQFAANYSGNSITTEWVLTEVCDGLASARRRHLIERLRTLWQNHERLTIIEASHQRFEHGIDLYCSRLDKEWSLTDCISFIVMEQYGLSEAVTGDHHFE